MSQKKEKNKNQAKNRESFDIHILASWSEGMKKIPTSVIFFGIVVLIIFLFFRFSSVPLPIRLFEWWSSDTTILRPSQSKIPDPNLSFDPPTEPYSQQRVLGVEDVIPKKLELSIFDIKNWNLESGLIVDKDGSICSRGRSDRPILAVSYRPGLSLNEVVIINSSVHEYKKVKKGGQEPKIILEYDGSMIFFPGPDIERINFDDKGQNKKPNKLPQPVDITKPMKVIFEPSQLVANKLAYRYSFKYRSTDLEIPEEMASLGSFESYRDGDSDGSSRSFSFGLYVGTCIKINSFDTSKQNRQIQFGNYFK